MLGRVSPKSRARKVKTGRPGQRRVRGNAAQASARAATRPGAAWQSPSPARSEFAGARDAHRGDDERYVAALNEL